MGDLDFLFFSQWKYGLIHGHITIAFREWSGVISIWKKIPMSLLPWDDWRSSLQPEGTVRRSQAVELSGSPPELKLSRIQSWVNIVVLLSLLANSHLIPWSATDGAKVGIQSPMSKWDRDRFGLQTQVPPPPVSYSFGRHWVPFHAELLQQFTERTP